MRRLLLVIVLLGIGCSGCDRDKVPAGTEKHGGSAQARPNVLLVTFDTTRADRLSCYGNRAIQTPTVDSLAANGVRYSHCYAPAPITLPSHTSLMTGLYPTHHQLRDNGAGRLDEKAETLAELLKASGYHTGAVVAAFVLDSRYGLDQGFDFYEDDIGSTNRVDGLHFAERPASAVTDAAAKWIGTLDQGPFFLWAHYFDPHSPYAPPGLQPGGTEQKAYDGEIAYADAELGRLIAQIKRRDQAHGTKTLVVFAGDHGESLHEHGEWTHGLFVYNATLRVPLIVATLGDDAGGVTMDAPVSLVDVVPTLLARLGIDTPYGFDGEVLPTDSDTEHDASRAIYFESRLPFDTYGWSALEGVVIGDKKYIAAPTPELYDIAADPSETKNLLAGGATPDERLVRALRDVKKITPGTPELVVVETSSDAQAVKRLAALGYVGNGRAGDRDAGSLADPKAMVDVHDKATRAAMKLDAAQWSNAAGLIREVLTKDPNNSWVLDLLIKLLQAPDAFADASEVARWRLQSPLPTPWDEQLPAAAGLAAARVGQGAAAQEMLENLVLKKPRSADLHCALAAVLLQTGQRDQARTHLEAALAVDPDHALALTGLGDLALLSGNAAEAIRRYEAVMRGGKAGGDVYAKLGQAYEMSGKSELAVQAYRNALAKDEHLFDVRLALAGLLSKLGQTDEAIEQYQKIVTQKPDDATAHYDYGLAYAGLGQFDGARREFERAVELKPDYGDALINLGTVLLRQKDMSGAEIVFSKARHLDAVAAESLYMLGVVAAQRGAIDQTVRLYEAAIKTKPDYFAPIDELSKYYLLKKDSVNAVRVLKIGVDHLPDNIALLARLGKILATSSVDAVRDGAVALALANHANERAGGVRPGVIATVSVAQAEVGDFAAAVSTVERAISLAESKGQHAKVTAFRAMLEQYRQHKPYRDPNF